MHVCIYLNSSGWHPPFSCSHQSVELLIYMYTYKYACMCVHGCLYVSGCHALFSCSDQDVETAYSSVCMFISKWVYFYLCIHIHIHAYVCVDLSRVVTRPFLVVIRTLSYLYMHININMHAYAYVCVDVALSGCRWLIDCLLPRDTTLPFLVLLRTSRFRFICLYVYIEMCVLIYVYTYTCICVCVDTGAAKMARQRLGLLLVVSLDLSPSRFLFCSGRRDLGSSVCMCIFKCVYLCMYIM